MRSPKQAEASINASNSKKRKHAPTSSIGRTRLTKGHDTKRVKTHDARAILSQTSDAALQNGELDVQSFLNAREFEIKALQDGMQRSKNSLTTRAFQQVPRDMRRRTASHNVKRVPKRLQTRAAREMRDDNTSTVTPDKRRPGSSRGRLRAETAKRLGILAKKKEAEKLKSGGIVTRDAKPKIRNGALNKPPNIKSKFRKRQIHKTWLPTHLWHTKRAKMTPPPKPLWRFAIPITSTEKSYRPTHRASGARGAVAWDMSYMSTVSLDGTLASLEKVMKAIGVKERSLWDERGQKWRAGKRSWSGWLTREINTKIVMVGPANIFWRPENFASREGVQAKQPPQQIFIRVHPSEFLEIWTELLRVSKSQRPAVQVTDLRFDIGSIEIIGPSSTETLLGILHPFRNLSTDFDEHANTFLSLAGLTNPSSLPSNSILSFSITDPRLHYPLRPTKYAKPIDEGANFAMLEMLSSWPPDNATASSALFSRDARFAATRLSSQKSLNRRKALATPGEYPLALPSDPQIPIMLLTSCLSSNSAQGKWTLLAPWKCILPIWYGIMHYPLSSGGNPRFGGLQELKQLHFEHGTPWYPADFPGTQAGLKWELDERDRRKAEWDKKPKGKRVEWSTLDLGGGRKGEIGRGWACDFEKILGCNMIPEVKQLPPTPNSQGTIETEITGRKIELPATQLSAKDFRTLISGTATDGDEIPQALATIRITLISRGIANPCARIYRLPRKLPSSTIDVTSSSETDTVLQPQLSTLRQQWLSLLPSPSSKNLPSLNYTSKNRQQGRVPLNTPLPQRVRLLAQSLLQNPPLPYPKDSKDANYPIVPDVGDLIGFVTSGEFNLAEGKGVAIGSVLASKVLDGIREELKGERLLCIVRNAGESIGRLARWEIV